MSSSSARAMRATIPPPFRNRTSVYCKARDDHKTKATKIHTPFGDINHETLLSGGEGDAAVDMSATLPPSWVDLVDEATEDFQRIKDRLVQLEKLQSKRIREVFSDDAKLEQEMELLCTSITAFCKSVEQKIHQIQTRGSEMGVTRGDNKMRTAAQRQLAKQLQDTSKQFREMQKKYVAQLRQRQAGAPAGEDGDRADAGFSQKQLEQVADAELGAEHRSKEIQRIAEQIGELHSIFKEMAVLVIDQGTVLDRIDFNVEQVVGQSREANVQLLHAENAAKNSRANQCTMFLVAGIVVQLVWLTLKFS
mmetsp:Transcript_26279/g.59493  ORF Transcript_26279/g.59493 Transcript_26279/m.59493 type:complete len:307 (+) Transcript_26279:52-972(+)